MTLDHQCTQTCAAFLAELGALSEDDLGTLQRAADLCRRFGAGIFPSSLGQGAHFRKLVRRGLLEFDNGGRGIDGKVGRDVEIYKLTERGAQAATWRAA